MSVQAKLYASPVHNLVRKFIIIHLVFVISLFEFNNFMHFFPPPSQVMRKSRSKMSQKFKADKPPPSPQPTEKTTASSGSLSTEAGSCLSSSASAVSSSQSRYSVAAPGKPRVRRTSSGPSHIERRAEAILKLLSSHGCSSEIKIRHALGDSPDTSKALRMCELAWLFISRLI